MAGLHLGEFPMMRFLLVVGVVCFLASIVNSDSARYVPFAAGLAIAGGLCMVAAAIAYLADMLGKAHSGDRQSQTADKE
jgi:hypothetical protein